MKTILPKLRLAIGAFRTLRRRAFELEQPGLAVWADAGEAKLDAARDGLAKIAHADEVADLEAAKAIEEGLDGLKDGRIDDADIAHLRRAARLARRSAELAHDIGEVAS